MKKATYQTARVHWRMGQALLPEHFYLQEEALRNEVALRFDLMPAPFWGVGSCTWNPAQLKEGIVSLQELTLVLESGLVIDVPGNTGRAQFNLNDTGETECFVYVLLLSDGDISEPRTKVARPADAASRPRGGDALTVKVIETEEGIERIVQRIKLSSKPTTPDAPDVSAFRLAKFKKQATGNAWELADDFLPPMVCVGPSPFFGTYKRRMREIATSLDKALSDQICDSFLSHESRAAARQCLRGVFEFQALLENLRTDEAHARGGPELRCHPYDVFRALHALYLHQCAFRENKPRPELARYRHEDLATCFGELLDALRGHEARTVDQHHEPFVRQEGVWVCALPAEARAPRSIAYWLIKKSRSSLTIDLRGVKIAARGRLHMVHQRALSGVGYRKLDRLPFENDFSSEVEVYELARGAEWDHVVQDGTLAFRDCDALAGTESFVWWRDG